MDTLNQESPQSMEREEKTMQVDAAVEVWDAWAIRMLFEETLLGSKSMLN